MPTTITSKDLDPVESLTIPDPIEPKDPSPLAAASIESLLSASNAPVKEEAQQQDIISQILSTQDVLGTEAARKKTMEGEAGLPGQQKELQNVVNQLQTLQKEQLAIPLQIQQMAQGRGMTAAGVAPIQAGQLRENAIKSLSLAAIGQTLQGNIALAQSTIRDAIEAEFAPQRAKLETLKQLYSFNKDALERIDRKRADNLKILIDERERLLVESKMDKDEIYQIGLTASKYGAPTSVASEIFNARSREEAIMLAGQYTQDPMAKIELENAKLDMTLKRAQIRKTQFETDMLERYGGMTPAQYRDHLKAEQKAIQEAKDDAEKNRQIGSALQEKIGMIDAALNSNGFNSSVGTNILSRGKGATVATGAATGAAAGALLGPIGAGIGAALGGGAGFVFGSPDEITGARQNFIGAVENMVSREFLDNLIAVKAQGATFGALTQQEQAALTSAATKIGQWRIEKDGKTVGYNASEADFRAELERIKNLARLAYERSTGNAFTPDEQELFDSMNESYQATSFNPAF